MKKVTDDPRVELTSALAEVQQFKKDLDALDDELAAWVPRIEKSLRSLRLGVRIFVPMHAYGGSEAYDQSSRCVSYDKLGGESKKRWGLAYEEWSDPSGEDTLVTPLANCSRELRAEIFENYVARLLKQAASQLKSRIEARKRAVEQAALVGEVLESSTQVEPDDEEQP